MRNIAILMFVCAVSTGSLQAAEPGLVAHYDFNEDAGNIVPDRSGNQLDGKIFGGATWVRGEYGTALEFNGTDGYVDCGTSEILHRVASAGTLEVWCCPYTVQGGLINWSTGGGWNDERLVLAVNTYHGGNALMGVLADGDAYQGFFGFGVAREREWLHLVFTFDGKVICVYRDGLQNLTTRQNLKPEIRGVPLWLGRCQGLGKDFFHGLLDEVRIFSRALSPEEIFASYKKEAAKRGKDTTFFRKVRIDARTCPGPGKILVTLDVRAMQPLPAGASVNASLSASESAQPIQRKQIPVQSFSRPVEVTFDAQNLREGKYVVRSGVYGPEGKRIGEEAQFMITWSGQPPEFRGVRILNNLVWELLNLRATGRKAIGNILPFTNPCDRWIYIRTSADIPKRGGVSVTIDAQTVPATSHTEGGPREQEAMQYLKAGAHTLQVKLKGGARLQQVVVRSIPMLQHAFYGAHPHIAPYGPYDWEFLKKDVLPNVNTMVGGPGPELEAWTQSGRKWIAIIGLPPTRGDDEKAVEGAYAHWSSSPGFQHPLMDGVIVDEFGGGDDPSYDGYRKAVERIYANPQFRGKMFIPYGGTFYGKDRSREFARVAIEGGGYVAWERYLREEPTEAEAHSVLQSVADEMAQWEAGLPGVTRRMVMVYGYMSQPTESLNVNPSVNYRVWMDMQIRALATHPAFFGLGGIQEYHSSYCDEENVRWAGRLYRHYAIEGNTQPLISDPYRNAHIQNPDFEDGTEGWTIVPAEPQSIQTKEHKGYSWLQGRYPPTPMGNTFLWMKRSATKPNTFSQMIKNLQPGRLYSLKMITSDYQDLVQEKSNKARNAVIIRIDNVDILPGPKNSFQFTFPNCYAHIVGKFNAKYPFWMNYHWRVFRAKGTTAKLTVADWESDTSPGGFIGQELIYNFIEVQPYFSAE